MEIIRFIGKFFHPEITTIPEVNELPTEDTYEQACTKHYRSLAALIGQFHPVYFYQNKLYYQVIDPCTAIEVDTQSGSRGITKLSTVDTHGFFNLILHHKLEENGYEIINAGEFKYHYTLVSNEINISVNKALQIQ